MKETGPRSPDQRRLDDVCGVAEAVAEVAAGHPVAGGGRDESIAGVEGRYTELGHGVYGLGGKAPTGGQVRHDDDRGRTHPIYGGD